MQIIISNGLKDDETALFEEFFQRKTRERKPAYSEKSGNPQNPARGQTRSCGITNTIPQDYSVAETGSAAGSMK